MLSTMPGAFREGDAWVLRACHREARFADIERGPFCRTTAYRMTARHITARQATVRHITARQATVRHMTAHQITARQTDRCPAAGAWEPRSQRPGPGTGTVRGAGRAART